MNSITPTRISSRIALSNHELVVIATYLAGGASELVDTEDIAINVNSLAPGRFSWRKYKEQINIEAVRKRLWDATKPEKGGYLIGSEKTGWRLTKAGFDFAKRQVNTEGLQQLQRTRTSQTERISRAREIRRLTGETAYQKILAGLTDSVTKSEAERFFRIDDYVFGKARAAKIERFRIIATGNAELTNVIDILSCLVKGD